MNTNVIYTEKTETSIDHLAETQTDHYEMEIVATTKKQGDDLKSVKKQLMHDYLISHHSVRFKQNNALDYTDNSFEKRDIIVAIVKEHLKKDDDVLKFDGYNINNFVFDLVEAGKQQEIVEIFFEKVFKHTEVQEL